MTDSSTDISPAEQLPRTLRARRFYRSLRIAGAAVGCVRGVPPGGAATAVDIPDGRAGRKFRAIGEAKGGMRAWCNE